MKLFGFQLFGKKDDEDEDDDFDVDDFELDEEDLAAEAEQAEQDELNEALEAQSTRGTDSDDLGDDLGSGLDPDFADLPPADPMGADAASDPMAEPTPDPTLGPTADDPMSGGEGDTAVAGGAGLDDLDLDSIDFDEGDGASTETRDSVDDVDDMPDFDDDDDYDDDYDEDDFDDDDEGGGFLSNPAVRYALMGFTFVLLLGSAGIAFQIFVMGSAEEEVASEAETRGQLIAEAPPAENTTIDLNSLASGGGGLQPPVQVPAEEEQAAAPDAQPSGPQALEETGAETASAQAAGESIITTEQFAAGGGGGLNALAGGGLNALSPGASGTGVMVPMTTAAAYSRHPDIPGIQPLSNAPDPELIEIRGEGSRPLPKKGSGDRTPMSVYARPAELQEGQTHVALVVTDLGLNRAGTIAAIRKLPPEVTLSFSPYAEELDQWMIRARRAGHEVMVGLPMESDRFPIEDPGPLGLMTVLPEDQNLARLYDVISLFQGFIGVEVVMGERFTADAERLRPLLSVLSERGLMILDAAQNSRSAIPDVARELRVPYALSDVRLDGVMARSAIDTRLQQLEETARTRRAAVGRTTINPAILDRLNSWFISLQINNIKLVPLSALTIGRDLS